MKNWEYVLDLLNLKPTTNIQEGKYDCLILNLLWSDNCTIPDCQDCPIDKFCKIAIKNRYNDEPPLLAEEEQALFRFLQEDYKQ